MGKIDLANAPKGQGTRYPAPYDEPCKRRHWLKLADVDGLTQFGVNLVTLEPGVWSSQRHWHAIEDEFVYVVDGELVLVTDAGEAIMRAGDCATFKAGVRDGHHFKNMSDQPARFLVVGGRSDADWGEYSDIDMKFHPGRYASGGGYTKKNGEPL
jgi:uncharacterized cupin superfamily protein